MPAARARKKEFMLRVFDAAVLLGTPAVCGFVGRNPDIEMDPNLEMFEAEFIPLLAEAKARGLVFRVEHCPMPGWNIDRQVAQQSRLRAGPVDRAYIGSANGMVSGTQFRIHYDPSHAILMGQDSRSIFQYLKDEGYGFLIDGFHVKGQVIDARGIAAWGYGGQTMQRGDWIKGKPSPNPADQVNAWKKQTVFAEHELPGTARHDPLGYLQNRTVDWLDHQLAARELLDIDPARTVLVLEHEYPKARLQDKERLAPILQGLAGVRARHRCGGGGDVLPATRCVGLAGHRGTGIRASAYRS